MGHVGQLWSLVIGHERWPISIAAI